MKIAFKLSVMTAMVITTITISFAQVEIWGTTNKGGDDGVGVIFKTNYNGNDNTIVHSFSSSCPGKYPQGDLLQLSNGKFYGYNSRGGACEYGNLFEYDMSTGTYTVLVDFDLNTSGAYPGGHLIEATNGKLYGQTWMGGPANAGTIFEYDLATQNFLVLTDFAGLDFIGVEYGSLLQATNGKLYGSGNGGTGGAGVIFEYDINTSTITKLYDFPASGINGYEPWSGLMQATNGKLYGMTNYGGVDDYGVLFEFDIATSTLVKKYDFTSPTGRYPFGTLMQASSGLLYGMTYEAGTGGFGGTLFDFDPVSGNFNLRYTFDGIVGDHPYGTLCEASNGNLYGLTSTGGSFAIGTLFEYNPTTQIASLKVEFDELNGGYPMGSPITGLNGKLYGLTESGGLQNAGNMFEYDVVTDTYTTLFELNLSSQGAFPAGGLTAGTNGKLYGISQTGGAENMGVVYEVDPANGNFVSLASFNSTNGGTLDPQNTRRAELCAASNGKFYGIIDEGGANAVGAIYDFDPATSVITKLADFTSASTGSRPCYRLIQASDGKLYGTTTQGGSNNIGTLFSYDISGNTLTKLIDFSAASFSSHGSSLIELSTGRLFGIARLGGGNAKGGIFVYDIPAGTYTKLADFTASTGSGIGTLLPASNGVLYGMVTRDGANSQGTIFSFDSTTQTITKLADFDGTNSVMNNTPGSLIEITNGKLFAMREIAGDDFLGDLFEFDIASNTITRKIDFECALGNHPVSTRTTLVNTNANSLVWPGDCNFDLQVNNFDFLWLGLANGSVGSVRAGSTNNWTGQPSTAWGTNFNNSVNYKHADCNGDGTINMSDSVAINLNYGNTHPLRFANPTTFMANADIKLIANAPVIAPGSAVDFDIYLADATSPVDSLYGIAFTLNFDPTLVDASQTSLIWFPSVLGTQGTNMESFEKYIPATGRIETALCRTDQTNVSNLYGKIGELHLVASAAVTQLSNLVVSAENITGITSGEELLAFNPVPDSVTVDPLFIGINENSNDYGIYVYPNPANSQLNIISTQEGVLKIQIVDSKGSLVYRTETVQHQVELPMFDFTDGIYFVNLVTNQGVVNQKVIISRRGE